MPKIQGKLHLTLKHCHGSNLKTRFFPGIGYPHSESQRPFISTSAACQARKCSQSLTFETCTTDPERISVNFRCSDTKLIDPITPQVESSPLIFGTLYLPYSCFPEQMRPFISCTVRQRYHTTTILWRRDNSAPSPVWNEPLSQ